MNNHGLFKAAFAKLSGHEPFTRQSPIGFKEKPDGVATFYGIKTESKQPRRQRRNAARNLKAQWKRTGEIPA